MSDNNPEEKILRLLRLSDHPEGEEKAPSRLKAQIFSSLIREQQITGPLQDLTATHAAGYGLCVFEKLVQIAPVGERAKERFFCWRCHARVLGEKIENPPIFWAQCPYVKFQEP